MKNTSLILCILAMMGAISCKNAATTESAAATETAAVAATEGKIVYIDLDRILMEYDMANDLRSVVETKVQNIQAEINRRGQKLEKEVASYQEKIQKGLMTRSVAEVQGQKLQEQEIEFNNFAMFFIEEQKTLKDPVKGRFLFYVSGDDAPGATTGPLVMKLTSPSKNGLPLCSP